MTPFSSLIQRLEAATEGSRALDHDIFLATHPRQDTTWSPLTNEWHYAMNLDADGGPWLPGPAYTTSLDDALTLVPSREMFRSLAGNSDSAWPWCVLWPAYKREGQIGDTGMASFKYMDGRAYAGIRNPLMSHLRYDYEAYGVTPVIALCIAILRALESLA